MLSEEYKLKQRTFPLLVADFIFKAYDMGYTLAFGEALRTPLQSEANAKSGAGIKNSLHLDRLAIDFEAYKNGERLTTFAEWLPLGKLWESLSTDGCPCFWGGRFVLRLDVYHFSVGYGGRK